MKPSPPLFIVLGEKLDKNHKAGLFPALLSFLFCAFHIHATGRVDDSLRKGRGESREEVYKHEGGRNSNVVVLAFKLFKHTFVEDLK